MFKKFLYSMFLILVLGISIKGGVIQNDKILGGGIHDYLPNMNETKLMQIALVLEKYNNKIKGDKSRYIFENAENLTVHELTEYIIKETNEHNEVNSMDVIEKMLEDSLEPYEYSHEHQDFKITTEVHELLYDLFKSDMITLLKSINAKYNKSSAEIENEFNDYILKLGKNQIRELIKKEIKDHPELNNHTELKGLLKNFDNQNSNNEKIKIKKFIKEYLKSLNRADLDDLFNFLTRITNYEEDWQRYDTSHMGDKELLKFIYKYIKENEVLNNEDLYRSLNNARKK